MADPSSDHRAHVAAASAFGLGVVQAEPVVAARGRQGRVWRVKTRRGDLAVKELLVGLTEREVLIDVLLQSTMVNRGEPAPQPLRTAHRHRPLPSMSEQGATVKALARQHQEAV